MMDPITIGTAIGTTLLTSFATKGDSAPLQTLDDLWYLTFGGLQLLVNKKRANHASLLESYKIELSNEVSTIPAENLVEPPLSIIGPALEASKFYIEEDTLRKMFAKLVAASMDNRKSLIAHQAFIEIIKQLSPFDAQNLALFTTVGHYPLANYCIEKIHGSRIIATSNVFLSNPDNDSISANRSSITNLQRLGLVAFRFDASLRDDQVYEMFETHSYSEILKKELESETNEEFLNAKLSIDKGIIELSPFGFDFIKVCL